MLNKTALLAESLAFLKQLKFFPTLSHFILDYLTKAEYAIRR